MFLISAYSDFVIKSGDKIVAKQKNLPINASMNNLDTFFEDKFVDKFDGKNIDIYQINFIFKDGTSKKWRYGKSKECDNDMKMILGKLAL